MTEVLLFLSQLNLWETILTQMKAKRTLNLQLRLCIPRNVEFIKTPPEHHQFNDIGEPHFHPHVTAIPSQSCKIQPTLCDLLGNNGSQQKKRGGDTNTYLVENPPPHRSCSPLPSRARPLVQLVFSWELPLQRPHLSSSSPP